MGVERLRGFSGQKVCGLKAKPGDDFERGGVKRREMVITRV